MWYVLWTALRSGHWPYERRYVSKHFNSIQFKKSKFRSDDFNTGETEKFKKKKKLRSQIGKYELKKTKRC